MNLENILENLLTGGIDTQDNTLKRRYKVLNIFQLAVIMLAPIAGIFYFYIGAMFLFYMAIAAGILMAGGIFLLRITKNLTISGNYAVFIYWAVISLISWNTGAVSHQGLLSPSWMLNAGLILLATFLNGYLYGMIWGAVLILQTGFVLYLFRTGFNFISLLPDGATVTYSLISYIPALIFILIFALLFERERAGTFAETQHDIIDKGENDSNDSVNAAVFKVDPRGKISFWDDSCEKTFGYSSDDMTGKNPLALVTRKDRPMFRKMLLRAMKGEPFDNNEWVYLSSDNEPVNVSARFLPLLNDKGNLIECVVENMNITENRPGQVL